jgi:23S rRNA-/tRNA-specific pseudouridylate synthase
VIPVIKLPERGRDVVWQLPVLFRDDHLLVLQKPAGLPAIPLPSAANGPSLLSLFQDALAAGRSWVRTMGLDEVKPVHPPEPGTSGVLVVARNGEGYRKLAEQFGSGNVRLNHLALVRGVPADTRFELDARLLPHPDHAGQMRADRKRGKYYRTRCEVLETFRGYSLLRCIPVPGRPGQVAAHLRHVRLPLVADPFRGGAGIFLSQIKPGYVRKQGQEERPLMGRTALHLEQVELLHPASGEAISVEAPLAKDFVVTLKYLRQFAAAPPPPGGSTPKRGDRGLPMD